LPVEAVSALRRRGLTTTVLDILLREGLTGETGRPTVWAFGPAEITIR
jgi:hypothetical protein